MPSPSYYELLKVTQDAPASVIRAAWRALASTHHPDRSGGDDSHGRMAEINQAYEALMDPIRRAAYDAQLREIARFDQEIRQAIRDKQQNLQSVVAQDAARPAMPGASADQDSEASEAMAESGRRVEVAWVMAGPAPVPVSKRTQGAWALIVATGLCGAGAGSWWWTQQSADREQAMTLIQRARDQERAAHPPLDINTVLPASLQVPVQAPAQEEPQAQTRLDVLPANADTGASSANVGADGAEGLTQEDKVGSGTAPTQGASAAEADRLDDNRSVNGMSLRLNEDHGSPN